MDHAVLRRQQVSQQPRERESGFCTMTRRVVTGLDADGNAAVLSDGEPPRTVRREHIPGFVDTLVWATPAPLVGGGHVADSTPSVSRWLPEPGETLALTVTFPPDTVFQAPAFDPAAARAEHLAATPGLAEAFEENGSGMHTTPTVDYGVVLSGSVVLDLDNGETVELSAGDVLVQNGVRHAWRNVTTEPAVVFFVLMGCTP
jgi:mannose-6-phosphate isomerase-like protein (cupin superfamily)